MAFGSATISQQIKASLPSINLPTTYSVPCDMPKMDRVYSSGTGAGQVDGIHSKTYSLAATPTTLDLTAMTDPNGAAITCSTGRIRSLWLQNLSNYAITIGAAASTQWLGMLGTTTSTLVVPPNGILTFSDPTTVGTSAGAYVDSTHKSLKIDPGANTVQFNLVILFCSAQS